VFWTTWKIVYLIIEIFEIRLVVSFGTINIDDIAYEVFNNVLVYDIIIDKLFINNIV